MPWSIAGQVDVHVFLYGLLDVESVRASTALSPARSFVALFKMFFIIRLTTILGFLEKVSPRTSRSLRSEKVRSATEDLAKFMLLTESVR